MNAKKQRPFSNIATAMQELPQFIVDRQLNHLAKSDPAYAAKVARALAMNVNFRHGATLQLSLD
jgi:catalase